MNAYAEAAPHRVPRFLRTLAWLQIPIAIIAVSVSLVAAWRIKPLIQQERTLKDEIAKSEASLNDYKARLQQAQANLDEQQRKFTEMQTAYEKHIAELKGQIEALQKELSETQQQLARALDLRRHTHSLNMMDVKLAASRDPDAARALMKIIELHDRGVSWKLGGRSPEEGFDSPGFAAFILQQMDRPPPQALPPVEQPEIGDLVLYRTGYVMFHFKDERGRPFAVGMTPFGITALDLNFADPIGYRQTGLVRRAR